MPTRIRTRLANYRLFAHLYGMYKRLKVLRWSPYENIYHCCTQKTASQWFRAMFSDPIVYKYTGLEMFPFTDLVRPQDARFDGPLPRRTIATTLYIAYRNYVSIPKPRKYRTLFVLRDPRDIVVSTYFSWRYSHPLMGSIPESRERLEMLSLSEGLRYTIDTIDESGLFWAQRSWMDVSEDQQNVTLFRYEDLARDNRRFLKQVLKYLNIHVPEKEFVALYERHRFENYSGGRKQGTEEPKSHYRKGIPGDWKNYFDRSTMDHFRQVTGDLLEVLGYLQ